MSKRKASIQFLLYFFMLLLLVFSFSCSGGGGGNSSGDATTPTSTTPEPTTPEPTTPIPVTPAPPTPTPPNTYAISGTLSGAIAAGVTINLTGVANASITTNAIGNYSFSGLANGNYTVTPSLTGYTFNPAYINITVNNTNANVTGQNFTVVAGSGGTLGLPKTGQTTSYAAGDDGALQKGIAWPTPRFTDNSNGTVTDNLTGLVWLKNLSLFDISCLMAGNWAYALTFTNSLASGSCGLTDNSTAGQWRLPNINELQSLVNYGQPNTGDWLNTQGFSNLFDNGGYWSSTTYAYEPGSAWIINVAMNGWPTMSYSKTNYAFVLPVRSGQSGSVNIPKTGQMTSYATGDDGALQKGIAWPAPRFTDNSNGTVTDNLTGLVWLKKVSCYTSYSDWTDELAFANGLASGSCDLTDNSTVGQWRLPNINELQSLVNYGQTNVADWLNAQGFSTVYNNILDISYWSSTTDASATGSAWSIWMLDGSVGTSWIKSGAGDLVWPVRSGH